MSVLFSPISLRSLTLPNRIVVSPMCQYVAEEGGATAWHLIHLGSMALSGAGLLCNRSHGGRGGRPYHRRGSRPVG